MSATVVLLVILGGGPLAPPAYPAGVPSHRPLSDPGPQTFGKGPQGPVERSKRPLPSPDQVAQEYISAWRQVEQRALGMTSDHAKRFRRQSQESLVRKAEHAYGYSESELRMAVRSYQEKLRLADAQRAAAMEQTRSLERRPLRLRSFSVEGGFRRH